MWIRALVASSLTACAASQEPAVGVSTAPHSLPTAPPETLDAAPPSTQEVDAGTVALPAPVALGRLHPVTGMSTGPKKLDAKVLIARIEKRPDVLDACSALASAEPNAPVGSWNVRLTLRGGGSLLHAESPVEPGFAQCLERAGAQLPLQGMPDGELLLLLGLQR